MIPSPPSSTHAPTTRLKSLLAQKAGVLNADDSVEKAGALMREHRAAGWPVVDAGRLVGMVKDENPDWKIGGRGHDPKQWQVGQIMSGNSIFCYEDEGCDRAAELMTEHRIDHLPVVDRQMHVVGILSRREIAEMGSQDSRRQRVVRRATEIAREKGRVVCTDDDFAIAAAELADPSPAPADEVQGDEK